MRIVCLSDTHLKHAFTVPDGDLLLHAGDGTSRGSLEDVRRWGEWLGALPHRHKVVIAGNHDFAFERTPEDAQKLLPPNVTYLQDSGTEVEGLKIWGSPWQPWFYDWAFNLRRGEPLRKVWALIPPGTDILVTHGPPHGILDQLDDSDHVGCEELTARLAQLHVRLHVFGHIHEAYGQVVQGGTRYINAATCDLSYRPVNPPIVVDLP